MIKHLLKAFTFLALSTFACSLQAQESKIIAGLLLTWVDDPTSTMVIDVHTPGDYQGKNTLNYKLATEKKWNEFQGESLAYPFSTKKINRFYLKNLKAAGYYEFTFGTDKTIYRFRTMPINTKKGITFLTGGDTMHDKGHMDKTNKAAMALSPDFIVLGGDLAYANGLEKNVGRWDQWFQSVQENLIDKDNRVVPIVVGIGNHEVVNGTYKKHPDFKDTNEWRKQIAPYFYTFFAFPGLRGYNVLDFKNYLSLVSLDTDHSNPIKGEQTQWLAQTLSARSKKVDFIFPFYHVPAYPSNRSFSASNSKEIRENFVPLFEKNGVRVAFENHDHTYKRTHPIFENKIDETGKGIVYMGDGAWGVNTRPITKQEWYLKEAQSIRHFIAVTLKNNQATFKMIDENGKQFDSYQFSK
jgi:hypothetical protein